MTTIDGQEATMTVLPTTPGAIIRDKHGLRWGLDEDLRWRRPELRNPSFSLSADELLAHGVLYERPEDIANRAYYENMPTRRFRVVLDVDVEWRDTDPDYSKGVIGVDFALAESVRMRNVQIVSAAVANPPRTRLPSDDSDGSTGWLSCHPSDPACVRGGPSCRNHAGMEA